MIGDISKDRSTAPESWIPWAELSSGQMPSADRKDAAERPSCRSRLFARGDTLPTEARQDGGVSTIRAI
jgi:hypothetical protein